MKRIALYMFVVFILPLMAACSGGGGGSNSGLLALLGSPSSSPTLATTNNLTAFFINNVQGTISGTSISLTLPCSTGSLTNLTPVFTTTGATVQVGTTTQVSGVTANDFSSAVVYKVTSASGSTKNYTVTVTKAAATAKDIAAFSINGTAGTISGTNITVNLPCSTSSKTNLTAVFTITGNSVTVTETGLTQTSGTTVNDFTTPRTYRVTDCSAGTKDYTVTVNIAPATDKSITAFSIDGTSGTITEFSDKYFIDIVLPNGTSVTSLKPTFSTTGDHVTVNGITQTSGTTANDFTGNVTYRVHACNGTTKDYVVSVYTFTEKVVMYAADGTTITGRSMMIYRNEAEYLRSVIWDQNTSIWNHESIIDMWNRPHYRIRKYITGAGTDGQWFTNDDTGTGMDVVYPNSDGTVLYKVTHGNLSRTTVTEVYKYTVDSSNKLLSQTKYSGAGTDTYWLTNDDVVVNTLNVNWSDANTAHVHKYSDNGVTMMNQFDVTRNFTTAKDTVLLYAANGTTLTACAVLDFNVGRVILYSDIETTVTTYVDFAVNTSKKATGMYQYSGKGVDNTWFTGDDVAVPSYSTMHISSDGYKDELRSYNPALQYIHSSTFE